MSATSSYYRPPHESYNKHWDVHGVPSSSEIAKFEKEYDLFVEATGSEYIPAFMLLNIGKNNKTSDVKLMVPDDDFDDLDEALYKVRRYLD